VEAIVRYFEYWLLRLQGVYPSVASCCRCGGPLSDGARLLSAARTLLCRGCAPAAGATALSNAAVSFLRAAGRVAPARLGEVPLPAGAARELAHVHRLLIAWHLEKELRSTRVLREMQH
jgi:recombinational DNA repair protein (RecF pathway)